MNVWTYWEGPKPEYIDVCLRSMSKIWGTQKDVNFYIVTPTNVLDFLPIGFLHKNYKSLPQPALKADCIRAALLARYGGWWCDADTIALKPFKVLRFPYNSYMTWTKKPVRVLNGYIYLLKDSPIGKQWLDSVNTALETNHDDIEWCSLGEKLLTNLMVPDPLSLEIPRKVFLPIDIDSNVKDFFDAKKLESYVDEHTICFGLNHSWFMYHQQEQMLKPSDTWSQSPLLIHQLLSWALTC